MKLLFALLSVTLLFGCGASTSSSLASADQTVPAATGTIAGTVAIDLWHCGGAALPPTSPPHGPCVTTEPYSTTFAVAKDLGNGQYQLVAYVTSDKNGAYSVDVAPGTYMLVSKYEITHDQADQSSDEGPLLGPLVVKAGASLKEDVTIMTPPPPISIGVGN